MEPGLRALGCPDPPRSNRPVPVVAGRPDPDLGVSSPDVQKCKTRNGLLRPISYAQHMQRGVRFDANIPACLYGAPLAIYSRSKATTG